MRYRSFLSANPHGTHRIVYSDDGPEDGPVVLCVHYLTGNGTYFKALGADLVTHGFRVVAVDMPGRGRSDDLPEAADYTFQQYMTDIGVLYRQLNLPPGQKVNWVGASMGGMLGIGMAGGSGTLIDRLVLIDVGPLLPASALQNIGASVGGGKIFATLEEAAAYFERFRAEQWGPVPEGYWLDFARDNTRVRAGGGYGLGYDAKISVLFKDNINSDVDLWGLWDQILRPVLVVRGEHSPILPQSVAEAMVERGPGQRGLVDLKVIPGCGHVPSMAMADQIAIVREWLERP